MVTSGEWEHWAVNNWRGVCYTIGLLVLSKVSWVPAQARRGFGSRKWHCDNTELSRYLTFMVSIDAHPKSVGVLQCFSVRLFISVLPAQYYSHRLTWTKGSQKGRNILYLKGEQRVITRSNGLSNPEAQNAVWIVQMWLELQRKQSATILIISWSLTSFFMQRWQKLLILTPQIWRFSAISNIEKDVVIDGLC